VLGDYWRAPVLLLLGFTAARCLPAGDGRAGRSLRPLRFTPGDFEVVT
jgi:hypothetical protein